MHLEISKNTERKPLSFTTCRNSISWIIIHYKWVVIHQNGLGKEIRFLETDRDTGYVENPKASYLPENLSFLTSHETDSLTIYTSASMGLRTHGRGAQELKIPRILRTAIYYNLSATGKGCSVYRTTIKCWAGVSERQMYIQRKYYFCARNWS